MPDPTGTESRVCRWLSCLMFWLRPTPAALHVRSLEIERIGVCSASAFRVEGGWIIKRTYAGEPPFRYVMRNDMSVVKDYYGACEFVKWEPGMWVGD